MKKFCIFWYIFFVVIVFFSSNISIHSEVHYKQFNHNMIDTSTDVLNSAEHYELLTEALITTEKSSIDGYSSFLSAYYDNLTYNLGMNYKGSCGYVAIAMLLSYYDTFLNDNVIPENYDIRSVGMQTNVFERRNSPGVMRDIIANPLNPSSAIYGYFLNARDYYSQMEALSSISLHAKLITIASARGYYNFNDNDNPAGTTFTYRLNTINDYLEDIAGFIEGIDYSIDYNTSAESDYLNSSIVRNYAIQKIKAGYPVLLSIGKTTDPGGHVVIAYEYDENMDEIYTHMGWGSNKTRVTIESKGYNVYKTALILDFESNHSHSNNYGVYTLNGDTPTTTYYCHCSPSIHTHHQYDFRYSLINNEDHKAFCSCGDYIINSHRKCINGSYQYCIDCTWSICNHQSPNFKKYNCDYHYKDCQYCPYYQLEYHQFTYDPNTYRIYCLLCGYQTNDFLQSIGFYVKYF